MQSVDNYFGEIYNRKANNCLHFAAKVWADQTNVEFQGVFDFLHGKCSLSTAKKFKYLKKPHSPCIAVFKGKFETHIGIYIRGKILHLTESGVLFQRIEDASISFYKVRFYTC